VNLEQVLGLASGCGPAATATALGIDPLTVAAVVYALFPRRTFPRLRSSIHEMSAVVKALTGVRVVPWTVHQPTLTRWLKGWPATIPGSCWVVLAGQHMYAVRNGVVIQDNGVREPRARVHYVLPIPTWTPPDCFEEGDVVSGVESATVPSPSMVAPEEVRSALVKG
jgi:hypothetical protein